MTDQQKPEKTEAEIAALDSAKSHWADWDWDRLSDDVRMEIYRREHCVFCLDCRDYVEIIGNWCENCELCVDCCECKKEDKAQ